MKRRTLSHLPARKREEIYTAVKMIVEKLPETQMIILFGSYARGDYTEYDYKIEFGIPTTYMSDYDILVITQGASEPYVDRKLENVDTKYFRKYEHSTPLQLIHDDIKKVNQDISDGRFFYNEVKREGIMLYDNGNYKLVRRRKLRFDEIKQQAEEYYSENYENAQAFLKGAYFYETEKVYKLSSFNLHQACENLFKAIKLTFTLDCKKQHNLEKMLNIVRKYDRAGFLEVFPRQTAEEKRLFKLLKAAYIEARYNPKFIVTKEDIDALTPMVEKLLVLTKRLCEQRIKEYEERIETK